MSVIEKNRTRHVTLEVLADIFAVIIRTSWTKSMRWGDAVPFSRANRRV